MRENDKMPVKGERVSLTSYLNGDKILLITKCSQEDMYVYFYRCRCSHRYTI